MKKTIMIEGMTCNHCKLNVEKAIKGIKGVVKADVSLFLKQAEIEATEQIDLEEIKKAISNAGYKVKE